MKQKINNILSDELKEILKDFPEKLAKSMEILQKEMPIGILELSNYGWYLGYDSSPKMAVELGRKLKNGDSKKVDDILTRYYEEELDLVEKRIIDRNPNRKSIIKEAFSNHRNKKYYSSIVLLLTQIDGLCYDETKKLYFKNNKKLQRSRIYKPEVEEKISEKERFIIEGFEIPLNQSTGISEHTDNISKFPVRLNRHEILHGIDYSYGIKINSLKIISFLNYINDIIRYK
ncbi:hypothetical protein ACFQ3R_14655 [Mesonia ostreae]|uniref:RiboL-PSP-HEPN domain-containing protein n=1 Tax=Mesonia ostreae TaxID=861110 RepID=A0ABU2KMN6_9FLAO|nr:hypothetical protein [Mesonia ostreae]MDT0295884.1 hypothetical protein [Mesonia ostreae]